MVFWTYILQSETSAKLYIGQTSDLPRRLQEHNHATLGKHRYTRKQQGPWRVIHSEKSVFFSPRFQNSIFHFQIK
jgi:predicted GIY-YIG superfamily endonuclease